LRLAIIFASRRRDDLVPEMTLQANHELLTLTLPQGWLTQHPLCKERRQYGELVRPEPSRFLLELPQDDLIWEQERKVVSAEER
ncbi:hypothetical protein ACSLN1_25890, partial [Escherichia coli]